MCGGRSREVLGYGSVGRKRGLDEGGGRKRGLEEGVVQVREGELVGHVSGRWRGV